MHSLFSQEKPRLSDFQIDERAAEARDILHNPVFQEAMDDIYSRAVGTLSNVEVGGLTATSAHATMKAIIDIKMQLEQYITDHKMRRKFPKEGVKHG